MATNQNRSAEKIDTLIDPERLRTAFLTMGLFIAVYKLLCNQLVMWAVSPVIGTVGMFPRLTIRRKVEMDTRRKRAASSAVNR